MSRRPRFSEPPRDLRGVNAVALIAASASAFSGFAYLWLAPTRLARPRRVSVASELTGDSRPTRL